MKSSDDHGLDEVNDTRSYPDYFDSDWTVDLISITSRYYDVSWHPVNDYALIGDNNGNVYKFYRSNETLALIDSISSNAIDAIDWKSDGSEAILVSEGQCVYIYDGFVMNDVSLGIDHIDYVHDVEWKPDDSYALIVGSNSRIFKYDGSVYTNLSASLPSGKDLLSVAWRPDGAFALISGIDGNVWKYDGMTLTNLTSGVPDENARVTSISWKSDGSIATLVGYHPTMAYNPMWIFDGSIFSNVSNMNSVGRSYCSAWKGSDYCLISGYSSFIVKANETISYEYNSTELSSLIGIKRMNDIAWHPKEDYALIVGEVIISYRPSNQPPTINQTASTQQMQEDNATSGQNLVDLRDIFWDDLDNLTLDYQVTYQEDASKLQASITDHNVSFIQQLENWYGTLEFTIKAVDSGQDGTPGNADDLNASISFNVTVQPTNDPPTIDTTDLETATENELYFNFYDYTDIDGDIATWSMDSNAPWLSLVDNNLSGIPGDMDAGPYWVNISCNDNNSSVVNTTYIPHLN